MRTALFVLVRIHLQTYKNCSFSDFVIPKVAHLWDARDVASSVVVRLLARCNEIFIIVINAQQQVAWDGRTPKIDDLEIHEFIET